MLSLGTVPFHIALLSLTALGLFFAVRPHPKPSRRGSVHEETLLQYAWLFEMPLVYVAPWSLVIAVIVMNPQHWSIVYWTYLPLAVLILWLAPRWKLRIGKDGFCIRSLGRQRFVPWSEFEYFEQTKRGIRAKTKSGFVHVGRPRNDDSDQLSRIESKAAELHAVREALGIPALLEDDGAERWLASALEGDFRTRGLSQIQLLEVLLDPRTSATVREALTNAIQPAALISAKEDFVSPRSQRTLDALVSQLSRD